MAAFRGEVRRRAGGQDRDGRPRSFDVVLDLGPTPLGAQADLAALEDLEQVRGLDLERVERDLRAKIADWRELLSRNVAQARQALRSHERFTFTSKEESGERFYIFEGTAVLDRLLAGIVLPKAMVAPRDSNP